jgi:hypothetical protein
LREPSPISSDDEDSEDPDVPIHPISCLELKDSSSRDEEESDRTIELKKSSDSLAGFRLQAEAVTSLRRVSDDKNIWHYLGLQYVFSFSFMFFIH